MTNYEIIKSLSIEEMIRWLRTLHCVLQYCTTRDCHHCPYEGSPENTECIDKCIRDWLNRKENKKEEEGS